MKKSIPWACVGMRGLRVKNIVRELKMRRSISFAGAPIRKNLCSNAQAGQG